MFGILWHHLVPPISTKQRTISHLKSSNTKKIQQHNVSFCVWLHLFSLLQLHRIYWYHYNVHSTSGITVILSSMNPAFKFKWYISTERSRLFLFVTFNYQYSLLYYPLHSSYKLYLNIFVRCQVNSIVDIGQFHALNTFVMFPISNTNRLMILFH
jgi:hypothetical protein